MAMVTGLPMLDSSLRLFVAMAKSGVVSRKCSVRIYKARAFFLTRYSFVSIGQKIYKEVYYHSHQTDTRISFVTII
jgi:hypothetical protein